MPARPLLAAASARLLSSLAAADCGAFPRQAEFDVVVLERAAAPLGASLLSRANGSSLFNFSFTTAWFSVGGADGLVVRNVECNPDHHSCAGVAHPEWTNAGALAVVRASLDARRGPLSAERVTAANVTWAGAPAPPAANASRWGFADPRLAFRAATGEWHLTYDNCTQNCFPTRTTMLSTSRDPFDPAAWTFRGPLLGDHAPYTAGAALLFRDGAPGAPPHLAFVGDSDTANVMWLAESQASDGESWAVVNKTWMSAREGCWDSHGVAPGPQPERLSSGDFLMIYNTDTGFPYRPNPLGRCSAGWAILDGADPTLVVARSSGALLVPELPYETCASSGQGESCQQPMVVFVTGLRPLGGDEFLVIYGGADTVVGVSRIFVNVSAAEVGAAR